MKKLIVGVMGSGETARPEDISTAKTLGQFIAEQAWILLSGGRNVGVMKAVNEGAKLAGGLTIGILPDQDAKQAAPSVDIPIVTGMGSARNNINILTAHIIVACGMSAGTASEVALAIKANKPIILLNSSVHANVFFCDLAPALIRVAKTPAEVINMIKEEMA